MSDTQTVTPTQEPAAATPELPNAVGGMELRMVQLDDIMIPEDRHKRRSRRRMKELRGSLDEHGLDTPLLVSPNGDGKYRLVAGGGRLQNAREMGWKEIHVIVKVRDAKAQAASTAIENMNREDLSPCEEADALELMLKAGYNRQEACNRVGLKGQARTSRLALVVLPESIRSVFGHDGLPPSVAGLVKQFYEGNHEIGEEIAAIARKKPEPMASLLSRGARELFRGLPRLHEEAKVKGRPPFIVTLFRGDEWHRRFEWTGPEDPCGIQLTGEAGEWFLQKWQAAATYSRPRILLTEEDIDQAIAIGAAYYEKGEVGAVWIHDRKWLEDYVNEFVMPRMLKADEERQATRAEVQVDEVDGVSEQALAGKLGRKFLRDIKGEAHSANLDLGSALQNGLGSVKLTREVAMFFAYEVLGSPTGERASRFSECMARVMPGWPTVERKKFKNGKVKETVIYLGPVDAQKRVLQFIEGAKTPEEILGRVLIVFAAAGNFRRECGANGSTPQQQQPLSPVARKALEAIVKGTIPASVKRVKTKSDRFNPRREARKQINEMLAAKAADADPGEEAEAAPTHPLVLVAQKPDQPAQVAELHPDESPSGRNVRKVIYLETRRAEWVANGRITDLPDEDEESVAQAA